jgi:NADH-ubiquinone oxidoreductase chain 5
MLVLILGSRPIAFIFGWDGLGVTRYLLVAYFSRWDSSNRAIVTILTNRLGDSFLLWFFVPFLCGTFNEESQMVNTPFVGLLLLTAITKSSQSPFSSWLPQAIAAPTPVSRLVHSSTLVTAGVFLVLKFQILFNSSLSVSLLYLAGWTTSLVSGLISLIEADGKKIVALSTLNQLGLIFVALSFSSKWFVLFHLVTHAFFKSCIFIQFGFIIIGRRGTQDSRHYSGLSMLLPLNVVFLVGSVFSLLGLVFTSGFYSKELILRGIVQKNLYGSSLFMLGTLFIFSYVYSARLLGIVSGVRSLTSVSESASTWDLRSSFLFFAGLVSGSLISSNYFFHRVGRGTLELKLVFFLFLALPLYGDFNKDAPILTGIIFQDNFYKAFQGLLVSRGHSLDGLVFSSHNKFLGGLKSLGEVNLQTLHLLMLGALVSFYLY